MGGDFNSVTSSNEVISATSFDFPPSDDFNDFLLVVGLCEIHHVGNSLSWCNNWKGIDRVYDRLDLILGNVDCIEKFDCQVSYLSRIYYDQSPLTFLETG